MHRTGRKRHAHNRQTERDRHRTDRKRHAQNRQTERDIPRCRERKVFKTSQASYRDSSSSFELCMTQGSAL